ncbi:MAG: hypothetical protein ACK56F_08160, partial [bacterium]
MNYEPLMDAIVQMILFLENSSSDVVDDDCAVGLLEQIAATLGNLGPSEMEQFRVYLRRRAAQAGSAGERQCLEA